MRHKTLFKLLSLLLCLLLLFQSTGFAQVAGNTGIAGQLNVLPGVLVQDKFRPLHLRSLSYDFLNNNFKLLLDKGDSLSEVELKDKTKTLLDYFFIGLSLPNDSFWVNLRPDSPDNIIDNYLAETDIGRIMLEADLQLKKDTAKATSPNTPEGKEYWDKLYQKAEQIFGSENIVIPTLTRPWIVPNEIIIRENADKTKGLSAYIYKATLKVMLEQDYLKDSADYNFEDPRLKELNEYSSQLIRELIIPKLTKEVNASKKYAPLRQVYYSLILAQWFKSRLAETAVKEEKKDDNKENMYLKLIDSRNLNELTAKKLYSKNTYFKEYQKSFKNGEYNIQQPVYTPYGQTIRSYFSGGIAYNNIFIAIVPVLESIVEKIEGPAKIIFVSGDTQYNSFPQVNSNICASTIGNNLSEIKVTITNQVSSSALYSARELLNDCVKRILEIRQHLSGNIFRIKDKEEDSLKNKLEKDFAELIIDKSGKIKPGIMPLSNMQTKITFEKENPGSIKIHDVVVDMRDLTIYIYRGELAFDSTKGAYDNLSGKEIVFLNEEVVKSFKKLLPSDPFIEVLLDEATKKINKKVTGLLLLKEAESLNPNLELQERIKQIREEFEEYEKEKDQKEISEKRRPFESEAKRIEEWILEGSLIMNQRKDAEKLLKECSAFPDLVERFQKIVEETKIMENLSSKYADPILEIKFQLDKLLKKMPSNLLALLNKIEEQIVDLEKNIKTETKNPVYIEKNINRNIFFCKEKITALRENLKKNNEQQLAKLEKIGTKIQNKGLPKLAWLSDQHANSKNLSKILELVKKGEIESVICEGDIFDRGEDNLENFEIVKQLKEKLAERAVFVLGNHCVQFIRAILLKNQEAFLNWIAIGGDAFLREVGITDVNQISQMFKEVKNAKSWEKTQKQKELSSFLIKLYNQAIENKKLKEIAFWLFKNGELFCKDELDFFHIHGGIPLDKEGNIIFEHYGENGIRVMENQQKMFKEVQDKVSDLSWISGSRIHLIESIFEVITPLIWTRGWESKFMYVETEDKTSFDKARQLVETKYEGQKAAEEIDLHAYQLLRHYGIKVLIDKKKIDKVCAQLGGVRGIVFGHTQQQEILNIDNRIFGIDVHQKKGFLQFSSESMQWIDYEGNKRKVCTKEGILKQLFEEIIQIKKVLGLDTKNEEENVREINQKLVSQGIHYDKNELLAGGKVLKISWANGRISFEVRPSTRDSNNLKVENLVMFGHSLEGSLTIKLGESLVFSQKGPKIITGITGNEEIPNQTIKRRIINSSEEVVVKIEKGTTTSTNVKLINRTKFSLENFLEFIGLLLSEERENNFLDRSSSSLDKPIDSFQIPGTNKTLSFSENRGRIATNIIYIYKDSADKKYFVKKIDDLGEVVAEYFGYNFFKLLDLPVPEEYDIAISGNNMFVVAPYIENFIFLSTNNLSDKNKHILGLAYYADSLLNTVDRYYTNIRSFVNEKGEQQIEFFDWNYSLGYQFDGFGFNKIRNKFYAELDYSSHENNYTYRTEKYTKQYQKEFVQILLKAKNKIKALIAETEENPLFTGAFSTNGSNNTIKKGELLENFERVFASLSSEAQSSASIETYNVDKQKVSLAMTPQDSLIKYGSRVTDHKKGGIDFRALPIVDQPVNLNPAMLKLNDSDLNRLNNINLDSEWDDIQDMVNANIIPSNERIKEYALAFYLRPELGKEKGKVLGCLADILRLEENYALDTPTELKNMLVLIEKLD